MNLNGFLSTGSTRDHIIHQFKVQSIYEISSLYKIFILVFNFVNMNSQFYEAEEHFLYTQWWVKMMAYAQDQLIKLKFIEWNQ